MAWGCFPKLIVRLSLLAACCSPLPAAEAMRRLWVLQPPDSIVEYDPATFAPIESHKVPPLVFKKIESLSVNAQGQMLFRAKPPFVDVVPPDNKFWFWNGKTAVALDSEVRKTSTPDGADRIIVEAEPQSVLSADGQRLYWFENEFRRRDKGDGLESSVTTTMRAWQTDLAGKQRHEIAMSRFPTCDCGTGVCSETCPEADFWTPTNGVDDYFVVTNWIPGQIGASYQSSFLCRKAEGKWSLEELPHAVQRVLDAGRGGAIIVEAVLDSACCGWSNESNDQTLLTRNGRSVVLFDEHRRYANTNYDISFFTSNALLSPDLHAVAMTITSSAQPGEDIRLSDEGKANPKELDGVRKAAGELPAVEVLKLGDAPKRSGFIRHATLVGWLNDKEILLIEEHELVAFDLGAGSRRRSQIKVQDPSYALIR